MELLTPIGRLVKGHPMKGSTVDKMKKPLTFKDGSPRTNYWMYVAIKKTNKKMLQFINDVEAAAREEFPRLKGGCVYPSKSINWKIEDGDTYPKDKSQGFEGCYIIRFSTSFMPQVIDAQSKQNIEFPDQIKTGDYVQVYVKVSGNGSTSEPGLYMNQLAVSKTADGEEIKTTVDYSGMFDEADVPL